MDKKYIYMDGVKVDGYPEGCLITREESDDVICLGEFEYKLLQMIVTFDFSVTIQKLQEIYQGDTIEEDVAQFCESLVNRSILTAVKS